MAVYVPVDSLGMQVATELFVRDNINKYRGRVDRKLEEHVIWRRKLKFNTVCTGKGVILYESI